MKKLLGILGAVGLVSSTSSVATACNTKNNNNNEKIETYDELLKKFKLLSNPAADEGKSREEVLIQSVDTYILAYRLYQIDPARASKDEDVWPVTSKDLLVKALISLKQDEGATENVKAYVDKMIEKWK